MATTTVAATTPEAVAGHEAREVGWDGPEAMAQDAMAMSGREALAAKVVDPPVAWTLAMIDASLECFSSMRSKLEVASAAVISRAYRAHRLRARLSQLRW